MLTAWEGCSSCDSFLSADLNATKMPVRYCRPSISAARQAASGVLTYASRRLQAQRQRQGQGQERGSTKHSGAPACRQKPRPKRQLTCSLSHVPLHKRFTPRRDTDAISHDRANPRSGPVRGLRSLTNCAHPASRPALRAPTPNWTATPSRPHVRDNGCRLELHKEKEVSDAGALLKKMHVGSLGRLVLLFRWMKDGGEPCCMRCGARFLGPAIVWQSKHAVRRRWYRYLSVRQCDDCS